MISERTRAALAAARERGVELGCKTFGEANKRAGLARAESARAHLEELEGLPLREIAAELTARTGENWNPMAVSRAIKRLEVSA